LKGRLARVNERDGELRWWRLRLVLFATDYGKTGDEDYGNERDSLGQVAGSPLGVLLERNRPQGKDGS